MNRAAFFDMDRTLVRRNTGTLYMQWRYQRGEVGLRDMVRVGSWLLRYTFGVLNAEALARHGIQDVAGLDEEHFEDELALWYAERVRSHISAAGRIEVEARRADGFIPVILSAGTRYAVEPLARDLDIEHVLCTQLEVEEGRLTGRCEQLCYGPHKVHIAERFASAHNIDLDQSVFYTDSISDLPMLQRVGEARVINPDPRLRIVAKRQGWPTEKWR
ncbi:MAG: HAD superfamily hydrolase (TIGR01490 family) [Polyangiales bacterium]|jgi:HAD superfamily hydrolase (TIGR01490 family)